MSNKKLKALCGCIYGIILCLFVFLFIEMKTHANTKSVPPTVVQTETLGSVQVVGNDNIVIINPNKIFEKYSFASRYNPKYTTRIMTVRMQNGDYEFSLMDAFELLEKITKYSARHRLTLKDALLIVHVESDFKAVAYNDRGKAYGLCQVTQPCLDEYNWNHNTNYTISQMMNPDLNLEVGFWYYNRILTHYSDYYGYITTRTNETQLRDAYIAYNVGVTVFNKIGQTGRNCLRTGTYPCNMYDSKKGDVYEPVNRFKRIIKVLP